MELNITLDLSKYNCNINAIDQTEYPELDKLIFIEFLCYYAYEDDKSKLLPIKQSKKISSSDDNYRSYTYATEYDGRYVYSKYAIYNPEKLLDSGEYKLQGVCFYYNNNVYIGKQDVTSLSEINETTATLISNWYTLNEYIGNEVKNYFVSEVFTFCKLNKCVINYQKQTLFKKIETCNKICKEDRTKSLRDFLFVSIYVLDYLVCIGNYNEAQRILESLSSCGDLCNDSVFINTNNNCNCKYE